MGDFNTWRLVFVRLWRNDHIQILCAVHVEEQSQLDVRVRI